jgi:hypothetical protein
MPQAKHEHPLSRYGYKVPPHWLWRFSRRLFVITASVRDIWLIASGKVHLHQAWQQGFDDGQQAERKRVANGGR